MNKIQHIVNTMVCGIGNNPFGAGQFFKYWMIAGLVALLMAPWAAPVLAEEDPIHEKCMAQTDRPAPWCYQETVEEMGDASLCDNIIKYWPKANGVHGWCYYRLAVIQKKCALCNRIKTQDIRKTCKLDACK